MWRYLFAAFHFAHRAFAAADIRARASADIFQRFFGLEAPNAKDAAFAGLPGLRLTPAPEPLPPLKIARARWSFAISASMAVRMAEVSMHRRLPRRCMTVQAKSGQEGHPVSKPACIAKFRN